MLCERVPGVVAREEGVCVWLGWVGLGCQPGVKR